MPLYAQACNVTFSARLDTKYIDAFPSYTYDSHYSLITTTILRLISKALLMKGDELMYCTPSQLHCNAILNLNPRGAVQENIKYFLHSAQTINAEEAVNTEKNSGIQ